MKMPKILFSLAAVLLCAATVQAQLAVTVSPVQLVGQKAVMQLKMKNEFTEKMESARAVCVVLNEKGEMVGQSTKWVIGQDKKTLAPKGEAKFNFVITTPRPLISSNLTAKVIFSRLVLDGGNLVDPRQEVKIIEGAGFESPNSH